MTGAPSSDTRDTPGVIAPPPLIALAAVVLGLVLDRVMPAFLLSVLFPFGARVVVGLALLAGGATLALAGERSFVRAGTAVKPWKPSTALITDGVFRWLRNPMYVGLILMLAGISIGLASDWTLVMTVAFALIIHVGVVKREERYLAAKFGDAYRNYLERVPRYGWPPPGLG
jgi:protein-S-isoprenylcysteine O-methyltransferase Ste14